MMNIFGKIMCISISFMTALSFAGNPNSGDSTANCSASCSTTITVNSQNFLYTHDTRPTIATMSPNASVTATMFCQTGSATLTPRWTINCQGVSDATGAISGVCEGINRVDNSTVVNVSWATGDTLYEICNRFDIANYNGAAMGGLVAQQVPQTNCTITCT